MQYIGPECGLRSVQGIAAFPWETVLLAAAQKTSVLHLNMHEWIDHQPSGGQDCRDNLGDRSEISLKIDTFNASGIVPDLATNTG